MLLSLLTRPDVMVGLRSASRGPTVIAMEARVCSVEWQRQCLHLQQSQQSGHVGGKQAARSKDVLPVVELRPFIRKVWRREKSLPVFYDKQQLPKDDSRPDSPASSGAVEPSPKVSRYIQELRAQQKNVDTRQSLDAPLRSRPKLHPVADFRFQTRDAVRHQQDLVPSFTTRFDRSRTTLTAVHQQQMDGSGRYSSSSDGSSSSGSGSGAAEVGDAEREMTSMTSSNKSLPQMCLTGGKLSVANLGRRPLLYLHPISAYRQKLSWIPATREDENGVGRRARSFPLTRAAGGFAVSRRTDLVLSGSTFRPLDKPVVHPQRGEEPSPHKFNKKLGAAHDSFLLLNQTGSPTVLERNLSHDLELQVERCRRERSFAPLADSIVSSTSHYVAYDNQPTPGEMTLMRARQANMSSRGLKAPHKRKESHKPMTSPQQNGYLGGSLRIGLAEIVLSPRSRSEQGDSGIHSSLGETLDDTFSRGAHGYGAPATSPRDFGEQVIIEDPDEPNECGVETATSALTQRGESDRNLATDENHVLSEEDPLDMRKPLGERRTRAHELRNRELSRGDGRYHDQLGYPEDSRVSLLNSSSSSSSTRRNQNEVLDDNDNDNGNDNDNDDFQGQPALSGKHEQESVNSHQDLTLEGSDENRFLPERRHDASSANSDISSRSPSPTPINTNEGADEDTDTRMTLTTHCSVHETSGKEEKVDENELSDERDQLDDSDTSTTFLTAGKGGEAIRQAGVVSS